jgi:hypothetical protein
MLRSFIRTALITLFASLGPGARAANHVSVWLSQADHSVHVAYHFPPGSLLQFTGEKGWQDVVRSKWWQFDDACFALEGNGIRLGTATRCADASIRLDWDERDRPRTYPALVRMRSGGVLVYAGYVEVFAADGKSHAEIRLEAPEDGVASFRDQQSREELALGTSAFGDDVSGWFYLGPDRFKEEGAARVLADDGVPPEMRRVVTDISPHLMDVYGTRLGTPYPSRPTFFFNWNARERPFKTSQADVVPGGDVRFGVTGSGWRDAGPKEAATFAYGAAHELAHLWNMDVFHHPDWASAWLHEGNAELLSTAALLNLGEIDSSEAADRVTAAALECALDARSRAWKNIAEREQGRVPYACGFAFQFGIVAALRRDGPDLDVFSYWREIWSKHPTYYEAVFEQDAVARGDQPLAALLRETFTGSLPVAQALRRLFTLGGLRTDMPLPLGSVSREIRARAIVSKLMQADCQGKVNYVTYDDRFEVVDNGAHHFCANLSNGMQLVAVQGLDLLKQPAEIGQRLETACTHGQSIRAGLLDGKTVDMPCSPRWAEGMALDAMNLDPRQVTAVLGAPSSRH